MEPMAGKDLRIIFMGTPDFAVLPLRRMVERGYNIVGVITTPDKPAGRGQRIYESAVKRYAQKNGLNVLQPQRLQDPEFVSQFKALNADLGIVIAFRMLPEVIWSAPRLGTFNLHASLLPQYRGAAPINWAIINGETKSGVTTFMLDRDIDTGDLLLQKEVVIEDNESAGTLHDKLMERGAELVIETVEKIASKDIEHLAQIVPDSGVKYAPKIFKEDCLVDWGRDCRTIHNLIRGLSPYPAAWTNVISKEEDNVAADELTAKLYESHYELAEHSLKAGDIVTDGKEYLRVACQDGFVYIDELQMTSKRKMRVDDFLRGFRDADKIMFR